MSSYKYSDSFGVKLNFRSFRDKNFTFGVLGVNFFNEILTLTSSKTCKSS